MSPQLRPGRPETRTDHYLGEHTFTGMSMSRTLAMSGLVIAIVVPNLVFWRERLFLDPFMLVLWVPGLVAIGLLSFTTRGWAYLAAGALGSVWPVLAALMFGLGSGQLTDPRQLGFIALWIVIATLVPVWSGAIHGFRAARGSIAPASVAHMLGTRAGLASLVAFAAVLGLIASSVMAMSSVPSEVSGFDFAPEASVDVLLQGYEFPANIEVQQGVVTELVLRNTDSDMHTFTYVKDGTQYNHDVYGGQTVRFLVLFNEAGEQAVRCIPHSDGYDAGMITTITVVGA